MPRRVPTQSVRDPLWGDIRLYPEEVRVVDSDLFQRQRGVKQLGTSYFVYPSAVQSRFVHAMGNLALIDRMLRAAVRNAADADLNAFTIAYGAWLCLPVDTPERREVAFDQLRIAVRIAGMCHDLGHLPMGHVVEVAIADHVPLLNEVLGAEARTFTGFTPKGGGQLHEFFTYRLLETNGRELFGEDTELAREVREVIAATHPHAFGLDVPQVVRAIAELVSSNVDSDRAEYLRRDGYVSGSGYGQYDLERLVESFTLARRANGDFVLRPGLRALTAVRTFLTQRVDAYQHLYYHNLGVLFDALLARVVRVLLTSAERAKIVASVRPPRRAALEATLDRVSARDFRYDRFAGIRYLDDARLWTYLWDIAAALEEVPEHERSTQLRRLRTYLAVLLRRRRHWVWLWKTLEEMRNVGPAVLDEIVKELDARRGQAVPREDYLKWMADFMSAETRFPFPRDESVVLNFVAFGYKAHLPEIAAQLEELLGPGFFIEAGHRTKFKPLSDPDGYELVREEPRELVRLAEVSPATVRSVQAVWFENPMLRIYVLAEHIVDEGQRQEIRRRALDLLPQAIAQWIRRTPTITLDPRTGFGGRELPPA